MIYKYSCKNFYSIKDRVEIRFDVNNKTPPSSVYVDTGHGRVSLVEAVIGPNASGKTNIIKALAFIRYLITSPPPDGLIRFRSFADSNQPTEVSTEFEVDRRLFVYDFILNNQRILKETIKEKSFSSARKTTKTLFSRRWDSEQNDYLTSNPGFKLPAGIYARPSSSVIASAALTGDIDHIGTKIFNYWSQSVITNVWGLGNSDDGSLHGDKMTEKVIDFFYNNSHLRDRAVDILRRLDVGLDNFDRKKLSLDAGDKYYYRIIHRIEKDQRLSIPFEYESSGTKRAILLLMFILSGLKNPGGIVAIDELDAYLHPDIVEALVGIFTSPETNPNQTQLLFSSHCHQLLAELDKQQITLVEKNDQGFSEVWRLDDITGVRADDNYYAKYIAGAYAAKPNIR